MVMRRCSTGIFVQLLPSMLNILNIKIPDAAKRTIDPGCEKLSNPNDHRFDFFLLMTIKFKEMKNSIEVNVIKYKQCEVPDIETLL